MDKSHRILTKRRRMHHADVGLFAVRVVDDPQALYVVQADEAITNALDIYGKNAAIVQGAVNTTFKASRVALDASTLSNDANLPLRIIDYVGGPRGGENGSAFPLLIVKLNYTQLTAAVGV